MASKQKGNQIAFLNFIGWFLSSKSEYVFQKEPWQKELFANLISESSFIEDLDDCELYKYKEIEMLEFNKKDYLKKDSLYLSPILRLKEYVNKHLKEYLIDFIIHGSMSTLDYSIGWSDLDTLVIIKKEILGDPKKLINLRKHILNIMPEIYAIDPLQHHQFIITTEKAMLHSYYSILPSETLKYSKSLLDKKTIKISNYRNNKSGIKNLLSVNNLFKKSSEIGFMDHHKKHDIALQENFRNKNCMYQLKYFLSCIMILPTYYLDAIGNSCYKKFSFKEFNSRINIDSEILEKSNLIREYWSYKEEFPYTSNNIPDWICEILGNNYFERAYNFSSQISKSIEKD